MGVRITEEEKGSLTEGQVMCSERPRVTKTKITREMSFFMGKELWTAGGSVRSSGSNLQ